MANKLWNIVVQLPDSYSVPMATIILRWAVCEYKMDTVIYKAKGVSHKIGRLEVPEYRTKEFVANLEDALFVHGISVATSIEDLQASLIEVERERNLYAHGVWVIDEQNVPVLRSTSGSWRPPGSHKKVSRNDRPEPIIRGPREMAATLETITRIHASLDALEAQVVAALDAQKNTAPSQKPMVHRSLRHRCANTAVQLAKMLEKVIDKAYFVARTLRGISRRMREEL